MSDEEIIDLWKKGWSIEKIANNFPSIKYGTNKKASWQMYNRVEIVVLNFLKKGEDYVIR